MPSVITLLIIIVAYYLFDLVVCLITNMDFKKKKKEKEK